MSESSIAGSWSPLASRIRARRLGAIVRPLGDVVVLMPPLAIEPDLLEELVEIVSDSIAATTGQAIEALAA